MTDQTESASEYDILCRRLAGWEHGLANEDSELVLNAIAAIRALEAKVHRLDVVKAGLWDQSRKDYVTMSELRAALDQERADKERLRAFAQEMAEVRMWRSEGIPCFQVADGAF